MQYITNPASSDYVTLCCICSYCSINNVYRKALRVSAAGRAKTSTGQVVNMMSNDTAQLQRFLQFVGMTLVAPIQIIIALVLINQQVCLLFVVVVLYCTV
jgi:ABC-type multidrug transport system fused ATPase/permease subunit